MKKVFLFIMVTTMTLPFAMAQTTGGIKAGLNLAKQKWDISIDGLGSGKQSIEGTSFHIGGYITHQINDAVQFQPELLYNSLKGDADGSDQTLNYLSIPVLLGYGVEDNKLVFQGGPQLGLLLSTDPSDMKDYMKGVDFSFCFGAQVNFGKFNLSARYTLGLTNIASDKLEDELEDALGAPVDISIKNNNLQFSMGYRLFGE